MRPTRHPLDSGTQIRREFFARGRRVEYFIQSALGRNESVDWLVLKFPGTSGRAERSTKFPFCVLPHLSGETWTLNPPGYGRSEGRASLLTLVDVASEFVQHALANHSNDSARVILAGNSLGCAAALGVAANISGGELSIGNASLGLMLRNVPPLTQVIQRVAKRYPLGWLFHRVAEAIPPEMDAVRTANRVEFPAVFFQSEHDELVPPSLQKTVHDVYAGEKRVVTLSGIGHASLMTEDHAPEVETAMRWLVERMQVSVMS